MASTPIQAANKTFRVSRQPQYKRNRTLNPLTPLNQERTSQRPINSKEKNSQSLYTEFPLTPPKAFCDNSEGMSSENKTPVVLLVPSVRFTDATGKENISSVPLQNVDYKVSRVLNKTLSPISTPEKFSYPLMTHFQSPLPVICKPMKDRSCTAATQVLSVKDALAVINSDLSCPVSPPNACSSLNIADSLETDDLSMNKLETSLNVDGGVSSQIDVAQPRLTFFVKSNKAQVEELETEGLIHSPAACPASNDTFDSEMCCEKLTQKLIKPKKMLFNSATVIKSKPGASPERSLNTSRTRTFRRRLLQQAPLVSSSPESSAGLLDGVSVLPVIKKSPLQEPEPAPQSPAFLVQTTVAKNNVIGTASTDGDASDCRTSPPRVYEDLFPVRATSHSRKRKSEEYLKDNSERMPGSSVVRQSSDETREYKKACHGNQLISKCKQIQRKRTGKRIIPM